MVDFINEVEEELRKEDYNKFLRKFGPYIAGIIAAIIAATGYIEYRKAQDDRVSRSVSATYTDAMDLAGDGDIDGAIAKYTAIAEKAPEGYSGLSLMRAAALKVEQQDDLEGALALYQQAATTLIQIRHIHFAKLRAANILATLGRYEEALALTAELSIEGAPFQYLAMELEALSLLNIGRDTDAQAKYTYLENLIGVPPTIAARAARQMSLIRVDQALAGESVEAVDTSVAPFTDDIETSPTQTSEAGRE